MQRLPRTSLAAALLSLAGTTQALTVYDPALGTLPSAQGWLYLCLPTGCSGSVTGGVLALDTLGRGTGTQAGLSRSDLALDTEAGYQLGFRLRIDSESHNNDNRAGFSLIAIGSQASQALEIGFWQDQVWVYDYTGGAFVKGAAATLDTTVWRDYSLQVHNGRYTLRADGQALLGGSLVDYSGFGLPYNLRNFLYLGDDTSSAGASVALGAVSLGPASVSPVPEPATLALMLGGLALVAAVARRRG